MPFKELLAKWNKYLDPFAQKVTKFFKFFTFLRVIYNANRWIFWVYSQPSRSNESNINQSFFGFFKKGFGNAINNIFLFAKNIIQVYSVLAFVMPFASILATFSEIVVIGVVCVTAIATTFAVVKYFKNRIFSQQLDNMSNSHNLPNSSNQLVEELNLDVSKDLPNLDVAKTHYDDSSINLRRNSGAYQLQNTSSLEDSLLQITIEPNRLYLTLSPNTQSQFQEIDIKIRHGKLLELSMVNSASDRQNSESFYFAFNRNNTNAQNLRSFPFSTSQASAESNTSIRNHANRPNVNGPNVNGPNGSRHLNTVSFSNVSSNNNQNSANARINLTINYSTTVPRSKASKANASNYSIKKSSSVSK